MAMSKTSVTEDKCHMIAQRAIWDCIARFALILGILATLGITLTWNRLGKIVEDSVAKKLPQSAEEINTLLEDINDLRQNMLRDMPLGTILPIALKHDNSSSVYDYIPANWVLCDGQEINERHPHKLSRENVHDLFWNTKAPKLAGAFLRGTTDPNLVSSMGGMDSHEHTIPRLSVSVGGPEEPKTVQQPHPPTAGGPVGVATFAHGHAGETQGDNKTSTDSCIPRHMSVYYIIKIQ